MIKISFHILAVHKTTVRKPFTLTFMAQFVVMHKVGFMRRQNKVGISYDACNMILTQGFGMRKVLAKFIPCPGTEAAFFSSVSETY